MRFWGFRVLLAGAVLWLSMGCMGTAQAQYKENGDGPSDCAFANHAILTIDAGHRPFAYPDLEVCFDPNFDSVIRKRAPEALGCEPDEFDIEDKWGVGMRGLSVTCLSKLDHQGLWNSGTIDGAKLGALLHDAGVESLDIYIDVPSDVKHVCGGGPQRVTDDQCFYSYSRVGALEHELPATIAFGYGFDGRALALIPVVLGALLVLPLAVVLWFRARAATVREADIPSLVFAHRRFMWILTAGGLFFWWTAVDLLHFDEAFRLLATEAVPKLAGLPVLSGVLSSLWLVAPFLVLLGCLMLSAPMTRLRGIHQTRSELISMSVWSVARFFLPVAFVVMGMPLISSKPWTLLLLLWAFIFIAAWAQRRHARAMGVVLQALTSGELRDRVFEIAAKGKAKLGQIYLMPTERMRMANAYAHAGTNIFLTDYLLKNLNRREVDAIVGHELSHLKSKHTLWRVIVFLIIAGAVGLGIAVGTNSIPTDFPTGPVAYAVVLLVIFFVSRRNEFSADAGSVRITGDAASLITGLAKVSSLNTMPIHWGKLDEKMLTHPSRLRRIKRLAKLGGIPESEIPQLIERAKEPPTDVYQIPPGALSANRVYSTQYKASGAQRNAWTILAAIGFPPAIAAFAASRAQLSGWPLVICYGVGLAVAIGGAITLQNFLVCLGGRKLEQRLRARFAKDGREIPRDGILVSVSPGASPRLFDNSWAWDMGILTLENDQLVYRGEETWFVLRREEIKGAYLGQGPVSWLKSQTLYIETQGGVAPGEVFGVRTWRGTTLTDNGRLTKALLAQVERWRGSPVVSESAAPAAPGVRFPKFGTVTSLSPETVARPRILLRTLYFDCFIGAALAVLFGFRVGIFESEPTAANSNGWVFVYVILAMWITHIVILLPFWRYREPQVEPDGTRPAPIPAQSV